MADTYTTNLNLTKPEPGAAEDTWGISLNADLDSLDAIFSSSGTQINLNPNQINFADGKKAVFGTGSDLEIYHDGSNSYIKDVGTGSLILEGTTSTQIKGSTYVILRSNAGENMLIANANGSVDSYYDGVKKLATTSTGIDVTGTVTSDGLTVDGDAKLSNTDGTTLRLEGSGASSGNLLGRIKAETSITMNGDNPASIKFISAGTLSGYHGGRIQLYTTNKNSTGELLRLNVAETGDISFYDDTGTSQSFFWDASAERLGIGTTSPSERLSVNGNTTITTGGNTYLNINHGNVGFIQFTDTSISAPNQFQIQHNYAQDNDFRIARSTGGQDFVIDSSGSVGIGTDSPTSRLTIASGSNSTNTGDGIHFFGTSSNNQAAIQSFNTGAYYGDLRFYTSNHATASTSIGDERLRIARNGDISFYDDTGTTQALFWDSSAESLGIGTSSPSYPLEVQSGGVGTVLRAGISFVSIDSTGSASAPSLIFNGDANTGIWRPASDTLAVSTAGSERMRIDDSGNVGIGAVPEAWTLFDVLQIGDGGSIASVNATSKTLRLGSNQYYDGAWKRVSTGVTTSYVQYNGAHIWNSTASGTLDVAFTETERMRIDSSGNLLLGDTSTAGNAKFYLKNGSSGQSYSNVSGMLIDVNGTSNSYYGLRVGSSTGASHLAVTNAGNVGIGETNIDAKLHLTTASAGLINQKFESAGNAAWRLGIPASQTYFAFDNANDNLSSPKVVIDSSGNLLVGKTANSIDTVGGLIRANGQIGGCVDGDYAGVFNRKTSDGNIVLFRKDGTTVGSIGTYSGNPYIESSSNFSLMLASSDIRPRTVGGTSNNDGTIDLGVSSSRFKDLYLSSSAIIEDDASSPSILVKAAGQTSSTTPTASIILSSGSLSSNASAPAIISYRDADYSTAALRSSGLKFQVTRSNAGVEAMTINSLGRVGIGTTSPVTPLHVSTAKSSVTDSVLTLQDTTETFGRMIEFVGQGSTDSRGIIGFQEPQANAPELFIANGGGDALETGVGLAFWSYINVDRISPCDNLGDYKDDEIDLGYSGARFKDLYLSGGVQLGGTGAANKLDDYEEGTWTPVLADATSGGNTATIGSADGTYTKVGKLVTVGCRLADIDTSGMTSSNAIYIRGLPFTVASSTRTQIGAVLFDRINFSGFVTSFAVNSNSYVLLYKNISGANDAALAISDITTTGSDINFTIQYEI